ncbi:alpha/beta hydrolase [Tsuneonella sp. SYSU-LHT278]|uniref:alpha/beta hydrolase n=1 Tax=Tsuneonella sediminis TaxID=3416089 RepID=UPI003F7A67B8
MRYAFTLVALAALFAAHPAAAGDRGASVAERTIAHAAPAPSPGAAAYGPFRVLDDGRAALVDATDGASVSAFQAMLRDHPGISVIEMVECPGTDDDSANLRLGRLIRARGIATHVPRGGSVRSGGVELFLAGSRRSIDDGAEFAVHAWRDTDGREPGDYATDSPYNRAYVDYYREMGVADPQGFYDMTNAVPNSQARWLTAQDMRSWLGEPRAGDVKAHAPGGEESGLPAIAYLDSGTGFP